MTTDAEGREEALKKYRILAGSMAFVGAGLLVCGIVAVATASNYDLPYFIGGFIVGIMIQGQNFVSMFTIMGCFIGCVFAGIGGISRSAFYEDDDDEYNQRKTFAIIIIVGCIIALCLTMFSMCTVSTYGKYFGVILTRGRRGRMVLINTGGSSTMSSSVNPATLQTTNNDTQNLETQNRLLREQLELQKQLNQQQVINQQQTNPAYPPPPPYGYM